MPIQFHQKEKKMLKSRPSLLSRLIPGLLLLALVLSACAGAVTPTLAPQPTPDIDAIVAATLTAAAPSVPPTPTIEPTPALEPMDPSALVDISWQWVAHTETMPASQAVVPDPENYTLVFRSDDSLEIKADCNVVLGTYQISGSALTITTGPSTLAFCGENSLDTLYLSLLSQVGSFGGQSGDLILGLQQDAGQMQFQNGGAAPVPAPTPTPIAGDPAVVLGPPTGSDSFNNTNNWTTFDTDCFSTQVTNGQFVMTAKGLPQSACWEVSWPLLDNFYIETTVQMPATCDPQDRFGLLVRAPDNNRGYLYGLDCAGQYSLNLWDGQQTTSLVEPASNPVVNTGPNELNRLGIMAYSDQFYLYANGSFLAQVTDSTYTEAGKIGYFVRAQTDQPFTVAYDSIEVWVLNDAFYPPEVTPPELPETEIPAPPPNVPYVTADFNVNVRSGPGMQFSVLGVAPQGTTGEVLGYSPDKAWYAVKVPVSVMGNETAWVSASFTTLTNPNETPLPVIPPPLLPPQVSVAVPPPYAPQVIMQETAVIRSGPSSEFPVFGITPIGARAEVAGSSTDGAWWAIILPQTTAPSGLGWVYKGYTLAQNVSNVPVIQSPPLPADITPSAPGSGAAALVTIEPLNVRSGPGNQYPSYGKVPAGTVLAVLGVSPDRESFVIQLPNNITPTGQGWVPARFVQAQNVSNVPVIQPPPVP
jgi:uncharacterized protein YraI/heat shock protein HslJ